MKMATMREPINRWTRKLTITSRSQRTRSNQSSKSGPQECRQLFRWPSGNNPRNIKTQGKHIEFAYDLYAKNPENFLAKETIGEAEEQVE